LAHTTDLVHVLERCLDSWSQPEDDW
jgi:hypothetical protein